MRKKIRIAIVAKALNKSVKLLVEELLVQGMNPVNKPTYLITDDMITYLEIKYPILKNLFQRKTIIVENAEENIVVPLEKNVKNKMTLKKELPEKKLNEIEFIKRTTKRKKIKTKGKRKQGFKSMMKNLDTRSVKSKSIAKAYGKEGNYSKPISNLPRS
ncbi:MAG: hypothetical protein LH629_13825 [Ignavibacteria bacterium]|nr:hypothetical protein [Ignavibacteria bacterium]